MKTVILGAGLAGLSAAHTLTKNNQNVIVLEKDKVVGGLSKTIKKDGYRFDFGGHRFWTKKDEINNFVKELMGDELIINVPRISKIYFQGKFFDYPLKPINSIFSMGIFKTIQIILDYISVRIKNKSQNEKSIEEWLVNRFGRTMFEIYFKPYTEKTWGVPCNQISAEWASQRIKGMSLREAAKNAFFSRFKKTRIATLVDEFMYPKLGIGRIAEKLAENTNVLLNEEVKKINHKKNRIISVKTTNKLIKGDNFISSIPITEFIQKMDTKNEILKETKKLKYRDQVIIYLMINKESITNDTWIYFPGSSIPFTRVHEPKNWSKHMVKEKTTSLGCELFCNEGDKIWKEKDQNLINLCIKHLRKLGFIRKKDVINSFVVRVEKAYPVYNVEYKKHLEKIRDYLKQFKNLQLIGRYGTFKYLNMDHVIEMGIKAGENILGAKHDLDQVGEEKAYLEQRTR